ncbi:MAG: DUF192 domain-containing protein [Phycisphaerales bacterium]
MAQGSMTGSLVGVVLATALVGVAVALSFSKGCDEEGGAGGAVQDVKIGGEWFHLEVAADNDTRMKGLGGRTTESIPLNGGMLFVLPFAQTTQFVMRDCPADLDIIYLSPEGRVLTTYEMKAEPARGLDEGPVGDWAQQHAGSAKYEERLSKQYKSRYPTQFVVELRGGRLRTLRAPIKEGDKIDLPYAEWKKRVR